MWPGRVSNPGPLALESDALPTALRGGAQCKSPVNFRVKFLKTGRKA